MRPTVFIFALLTIFVAAFGGHASAAEQRWHSEQPVAAGIEVPVPFGEVGDIECWQANRCVLITPGNGGMPAGIYAYDGVNWHLYSTVCGGHHGRIAWAGPDEFWTISDQRVGEEPGGGSGEALLYRSLCHFANGEVVASYAQPIGQASSYSKMDAAACEGPSDCWFGGEHLSGEPNTGAFHLHWDGSTLSAIPSLTVPEAGLEDPGWPVFDLAFDQGRLYESVSFSSSGQPVPGETEPVFLHRVNPGAAQPFELLATPGLVHGGPAAGLEGFRFAGSGSELWAMSGAVEGSNGASTTVTMLRLEENTFRQVPLSSGPFVAGDEIGGFAVEPTAEAAWASFTPPRPGSSPPAQLARIDADGNVVEEVRLPRPEEEINNKGTAGPITCPTAGQCWMATSKGWLFHLGGAPAEGPDTDPNMHQLITFRPCDEACRSGVEVGVPEDNSGAELEAEHFPISEPYERPPSHRRKPQPLYNHLHQKLIHKTVLQITFLLHARAHVQLVAKQHKQVVAKTARFTFGKGHHRILLQLDPEHWPTHLSFQVHRIHKKAA